MAEKGYQVVLRIGGVILGRANDMTWSDDADELDTTGFDSTGYAAYDQGLKRVAIDITSFWVPTHAAYQAARAAYTGGTEIQCRWVDSTGAGKQCQCIIINMTDTSPVAEAVTTAIRLRGTGAVTDLAGSS